MLVEHARNVMGIADATHAEYGRPGTAVVTALACSLVDAEIEVMFTPGSRLAACYGRASALERTTCSYGLEPAFGHLASEGGLSVAATAAAGDVRAVERPDHPFFVATLYQPQLSSTRERPHPIWTAFVDAVLA